MLASLVLASLLGAQTAMPLPATFPAVSGHNLNGRPFDLPKDFGAPLNLVFVAFARDQQAQVDSWKAAAADAVKRYPELGVWELPTLSRGNALFRGFIDGGMRRGIPDQHARDTTITLYLDKRTFDEKLGIAGEDAITVLLVRPSGEIVWRTTGASTAAAAAELEAAIAGAR